MAAFDKSRAAEARVNGTGGGAKIFGRANLASNQDFGLGAIWRDEGGERQELGLEDFQGAALKKAGAACGDHDGINDKGNWRSALQERDDLTDDPGGIEHARLGGVGSRLGEDGFQLGADHFRRDGLDARDGFSILRGEASDGRGAVNAKQRENAQVGLDAGAAAAVGACDGERDGAHWEMIANARRGENAIFMTRRECLKQLGALAALGAAGCQTHVYGNRPLKLGVASFSLDRLTPDQVIAALKELDIQYVSLFKTHCPWGGTAEQCRAAAQKFRDAGLTVTGSGVIELPNNEAALRKAFDNAKAAELPTMICKPAPAALPLVDKFVKEYDLRLAIHNHGPEDKTYPGPAEAWKAAAPFDERIGLCIDVGHCFRAGQDPAAAIRSYRERLYDIHMKDLKLDANGKEIPAEVGKGTMDIKGILAALKEIRYDRIVAFEYEKRGGDHVEGLRESIAYVRPLAA